MIAGTGGPVVLDGGRAAGTLGVRPEHMQLAFEDGVRAAVASVEYLGSDSLVTCRIGAQMVAVRTPGSVPFAPGDATWIRWPRGRAALLRPRRRAREHPADAARATLVA